jgi:CubicO group peptidase (beta-lactamase class C family)
MFMTSAALVSHLTGRSYRDYVKSAIFDPLNMTSTTFDPIHDARDRVTATYNIAPNGTVYEVPYWQQAEDANLDTLAGPGGIVSSTRDLAKWVAFLIESVRRARSATVVHIPGQDLHAGILSDTSILQMTTAHSIRSGLPSSPLGPVLYGLGLGLTTYRGEELISHGGDLPGFQSLISWMPQVGKGVVCLTNGSPCVQLARKLLGLANVSQGGRARGDTPVDARHGLDARPGAHRRRGKSA